MSELITICFKEKNDSHKDIVVDIPKNEFHRTFDSYYLGLDDKIKTSLEGIEKIKLVLVSLIKYWLKTISEAKSNQPFYLPIDFSDQYTGCFRIEKKDGELLISYGYSHMEGWSIFPSDPGDFSEAVSDYEEEPEFQSFLAKENEFVSSLNKSIESLSSTLNSQQKQAHG